MSIFQKQYQYFEKICQSFENKKKTEKVMRLAAGGPKTKLWGPLIVPTASHRDSPGAQDRGSRASWFETRGSRLVIEDRRGNQTLHFVPEARWRIYLM